MSLTPVLFSVSYSGSWGQANLSVEQFVDKAADGGNELFACFGVEGHGIPAGQ